MDIVIGSHELILTALELIIDRLLRFSEFLQNLNMFRLNNWIGIFSTSKQFLSLVMEVLHSHGYCFHGCHEQAHDLASCGEPEVSDVMVHDLLRELGDHRRMHVQVVEDLAIGGCHELGEDFLVFLVYIRDNFLEFWEDLGLFLLDSLLQIREPVA